MSNKENRIKRCHHFRDRNTRLPVASVVTGATSFFTPATRLPAAEAIPCTLLIIPRFAAAGFFATTVPALASEELLALLTARSWFVFDDGSGALVAVAFRVRVDPVADVGLLVARCLAARGFLGGPIVPVAGFAGDTGRARYDFD